MVESIAPLHVKEIDRIKEKCKKNQTLWEDKLFPANNKSISQNKKEDLVIWKRPMVKI